MPKGYKTAKVQAREEARKAVLVEEGVTAAKTMREIGRLAFSDIRAFFDDKGNLRPVHTLSDEAAAALSGLETVQRNLTSGDDSVDTIHKIKIWDKPKNLEMLAKHFGLLEDKLEHSGVIEIRWKGDE